MKVEEPEDGYIPQPEHEEGGNTPANKRSASTDQKENASPKKRRTKTTDIALENPPTDEVPVRYSTCTGCRGGGYPLTLQAFPLKKSADSLIGSGTTPC